MTDIVAQLVGALEAMLDEDDGGRAAEQARAALSAAKDGGWVAVPVEMTDEMRDAGNEWIGNRFLLGKAYAAILAAKPLLNPPKGEV